MDSSLQSSHCSTADRSCAETAPVIVVGAGPVGVHFANRLTESLPEQSIKLFGAEPELPYDRVRLSDLLGGRRSWHEVFTPLAVDQPNLQPFYHCAIREIHTGDSCVVDAQGRRHSYSKLVIATGSRARVPDIPGVGLNHVYSFRDLRDTEKLSARCVASRHVVVIGGGLLGVEAGHAMARYHTHVTVVQQAPYLMNRQLDEVAARYLENSLLSSGLSVRTGAGVRALLPDPSNVSAVGAVLLRNGVSLPCDTVVFATGIVPNVALARAAGIAVGRGIKVDSTLRTSAEGVYAIGECAEFCGQLYGLVAPGLEQASVVAAHLAGRPVFYMGSMSAARLKVAGEQVFSAGIVSEDETTLTLQPVVFEDNKRGLYRKLLIYRGQLVGVIAYGAWDEAVRMQEMVCQRRRVFLWQLKRFQRSGSLWDQGDAVAAVSSWPRAALVCNCRSVTRGQLSDAIASGCDSVACLAVTTGASTVCGSCEGLLQNLVTGSAKATATPAPVVALTAVSAAVAAILLVVLTQYSVPVSSSVQQMSWWELLSTDSFYKQVTGYSMICAGLLGLAVSLKKRVLIKRLGHFNYWRLWHLGMGVLAIALLMLHTGFESGDNLNQWLLYDFLALAMAGSVAGLAVSAERQLGLRQGKRLRSWTHWSHLLLSWPLPALLIFHITSVYYF